MGRPNIWVPKIMEFAEKKYQEKDQYFCTMELVNVFGIVHNRFSYPLRLCVENGGLIRTSMKGVCTFLRERKHDHYILNKKPGQYSFTTPEDELEMIESQKANVGPEKKKKRDKTIGRPKIYIPESSHGDSLEAALIDMSKAQIRVIEILMRRKL